MIELTDVDVIERLVNRTQQAFAEPIVVDGIEVLAEIKTSTTADVTSGIVTALRGLVDASGVSADAVQAVMIGLAMASLLTWTIFLAKKVELSRANYRLRAALEKIAESRSLAEAQIALGAKDTVLASLLSAAMREARMSAGISSDAGTKERAASSFAEIVRAEARQMRRGMGALAEKMGMQFLEFSVERCVATLPVEGNTQPVGLLHGGAYVVLGESLGSMAANLHAGPGRLAVGVDGVEDGEEVAVLAQLGDVLLDLLAQLVGASRETVNKALADFASRGWLRL